MAAKLLDGEAVAAKLQAEIQQQTDQLKARGLPPRLTAVQVGESPASKVYTNNQAKACQAVGIEYELKNLPADISQEALKAGIDLLNADPKVTGIILQLPLPPQIDGRTVQTYLDPGKDVEGVHPANFGRLFSATGLVGPCTALAAVELVKSTGVELAGMEAVVVGHSEIVGKPIAMLLLQSLNASPTVTVCHVATRGLAEHTRRAEILFVATGVRQARWQGYQSRVAKGEKPPRPNLGPLIAGDMIRPGAIVIDVAINRIPAGFDEKGEPVLNEKGRPKLVTVGDVDFEAAQQVAGWITPVPGGVGPVTVAILLRNTIRCAERLAPVG